MDRAAADNESNPKTRLDASAHATCTYLPDDRWLDASGTVVVDVSILWCHNIPTMADYSILGFSIVRFTNDETIADEPLTFVELLMVTHGDTCLNGLGFLGDYVHCADTSTVVQEDEVGFDCATMGNHVCGYDAGPHPLPTRH